MKTEFSSDICELLSNHKNLPETPVREHKKQVGKYSTFCAQFICNNDLLNVVYLGHIEIGWINHVLGHCHRQRKPIRLFVGIDTNDPKVMGVLDNLMLMAKELELTGSISGSIVIASANSLIDRVKEAGVAIDMLFLVGFTQYQPLVEVLEQFEKHSTVAKPVYCGDNFFVSAIRRAINDHCIKSSQICIWPENGRLFIASTKDRIDAVNKAYGFPVFPLAPGLSTSHLPLRVVNWNELREDKSDRYGMLDCRMLLPPENATPAVSAEIIIAQGVSSDHAITWQNKVATRGEPIYGGVFSNVIMGRADEFLALQDQSILKPSVGMAKPSEKMRILSYFQNDLQHAPGGTVLLCGPAQNNYYHWLIDILPKMHVVDSFEEVAKDFKIGIPGLAFQKETLSILGVPEEKIFTLGLKRGYRFEKSIFIDRLSGNGWQLHPSLGVFLRDFGRKALSKTQSAASGKRRRIYIDRRGAKRRKILNEEELVRALERLDFEIVQLEKFTISQQIALFNDVSMVVAPHGAGLTNLIFCTGNVSVVEIFCEIYLNSCFWHLGAMSSATFKWQSLVFPGENVSEDKHNFSFHVDVPLITKAIADL